MANANTNGKKHGKLELHLYSTGRAGECSTDKCHDKRTLIYHRGTLGWSPSFICEDCLADLLEAYVRLVGKDKAKEVLSASLELLRDEPQPGDEPQPVEDEKKPESVKPQRRSAKNE